MMNDKWKRPSFPKRAVVTAGMPYGNKELHFGHVGGVFVYADVFARFMRQRIGAENVIFTSGTDCYGSTIEATYNKLAKEEKYILNTIEEFLKPPMLHVRRNYLNELKNVQELLPKHTFVDEKKKPSVALVFSSLEERDKAREILDSRQIRFRTGKTLVPFRLSGNVKWGVDVPEKEGLDHLTFWVWPESLWAPISFTRTYLESKGECSGAWKDWWLDNDSKAYQFIGEDNIYFYGIAEMGLIMALRNIDPEPNWEEIMWPHIIANKHILFMNEKASSSSETKPPTAKELLLHYTPEQLRLHFLSLGLSKKSVSFSPQAFMSADDQEGKDAVIQSGNLLMNVFNRLVRSYFYTSSNYFEQRLPKGTVSFSIIEESKKVILSYEKHMYNHDFHRIVEVLDTYIRKMSKHWAKHMKGDDLGTHIQAMTDALHNIRTIMTLLYPIAPEGCEKIREYFNIDKRIWEWQYIFETFDYFVDDYNSHKVKHLEPRTDFFKKIYME